MMNTATKQRTFNFIHNPSIEADATKYMTVDVSLPKILDSWKNSLFAFEWLTPDGTLKDLDDLPMIQHEKRLIVEKKMETGKDLAMPVLGFGLLDTVEIGSGKAVLLTLAAHGEDHIPAHILKSDQDDFEPFLV